MSESNEVIAHSDLSKSKLDAEDLELGGEGTRVYHESDVGEMDSLHDGRRKTVLINEGLVPAAGDLLIDVVDYDPGVSCPVHYHDGTDHFFYILEGEGVLEVEGEEIELSQGSVAWIGEGDSHRLFAREGQEGMRVFEYFSDGDHESVFEDEECSWSPDSVDE
jgi:quercetin dioxygenase-like cupin family protein